MDINDFLNTENTHFALRPFKLGNKVIANDGYSLLAVPEFGDYQELGDTEFSRIVAGYLHQIEAAELTPMPAVQMPELCECPRCKGTGTSTKEVCRECAGEGEVDAETDYSTYDGLTCKSCEGDGYKIKVGGDTVCLECKGAGKVIPQYSLIEVDGITIRARLLSKILNEPGLMIKAKGELLFFKAGDAMGILMATKV